MVRQWYQPTPLNIHPLSITTKLPQVISFNVTCTRVVVKGVGRSHVAVSVKRPPAPTFNPHYPPMHAYPLLMTVNWNSETLHRKWAFKLGEKFGKLPLALPQTIA